MGLIGGLIIVCIIKQYCDHLSQQRYQHALRRACAQYCCGNKSYHAHSLTNMSANKGKPSIKGQQTLARWFAKPSPSSKVFYRLHMSYNYPLWCILACLWCKHRSPSSCSPHTQPLDENMSPPTANTPVAPASKQPVTKVTPNGAYTVTCCCAIDGDVNHQCHRKPQRQ